MSDITELVKALTKALEQTNDSAEKIQSYVDFVKYLEKKSKEYQEKHNLGWKEVSCAHGFLMTEFVAHNTNDLLSSLIALNCLQRSLQESIVDAIRYYQEKEQDDEE